MWQHIGASRFIWNYMLASQEQNYQAGGEYLSAFSLMKLLAPLKKEEEYEWLKSVGNHTLTTVCRDLDKAYQLFFRKLKGHPKFKIRKRSKPSFPVRSTVYFTDGCVQIAKLGKVIYQTNHDIPQGRGHKFSDPRVSYLGGKWLLMVGMERENQAPMLTEKSMGIDLGIKDLATVSFGGEQLVFHNINKSRRVRQLERRMKHHQRNASRKRRINGVHSQSARLAKEDAKAASIYRKLTNIRRNYIHQTTHILVSMLPRRITMEDLNVTAMMKNHCLAKAIAEQCFAEFIRQMRYKSAWNGIEFQQALRMYPSSKTCSCCGNIKRDLKLKDRTYVCDMCGLIIDRDFNAALNLERYDGNTKRAVGPGASLCP